MRWRRHRALLGAGSLVVVVALSTALSHLEVVSAAPSLPQDGAWFGAFVEISDHTGTDRQTAMLNFEALVGRPMALDRQYRWWDDQFLNDDDYWTRDQGRTLVIDLTNRLSDQLTYTRWADIAGGAYDAELDADAAELVDFGAPVYFTFDHEPERWVDGEGDPKAGTMQDFIRAYQHVHDRFQDDGVANVSYVLTLMARTYASGLADDYYPGDPYVDLLASDGYNWYGCPSHPGPWRSFQSIFGPFHTYGVAKGKQLFIPEWGSEEDPAQPDRKAQWFADALGTLKGWPEVKGVMYFDSAPDGGCTWWVDSSAQSLAAYQAMGADPYVDPPAPGAPPGVSITSGPPDPAVDSSATLEFSSPDPGSTFTCSLDDAPAQSCASGITYSELAEGAHTFSVQATDQNGEHGDAAFWDWTIVPLGAEVSAADFSFTPPKASTKFGAAVRWTFIGPSDHTVTDRSGLGLFDSGTVHAGSTFSVAFVGAGLYRYACTLHPSMKGVVSVAPEAPATGSVGIPFTVTWGSGSPPPADLYDVQVKVPGSAVFVDWLTGVADASADYTAQTPGAYAFRARVRDPISGLAARYSAAVRVQVS